MKKIVILLTLLFCLVSCSKPVEIHEVTISAVGDLMVHDEQLVSAYDRTSGTFNFETSFEAMKPYLSEADLTLGNLETTFSGKDGIISMDNIRGYTGYPRFNTPDALAQALKEAGFDLLSTANNHALDGGLLGLSRTLKTLDDAGLSHVGSYDAQKASKDMTLMEIKGISFVFIAATYGSNEAEALIKSSFCLDELDGNNLQKVRDAKALNPDVIVVMAHYGEEYSNQPDTHQRELTTALFKAGADVVLGSHPHVLQPIEIQEIVREDGVKGKGFVIYSMGNFIASQVGTEEVPKDIGVVLTMNFEKIGEKKAELMGFSLVPTYTCQTTQRIYTVPVEETLALIQSGNMVMTPYDVARLSNAHEDCVKALMQNMTGFQLDLEGYPTYVSLE